MIHLDHALFTATVLEQGAQLVAFTPKGQAPLLWHADFNTYVEGKPFRGGIPICWPWFGKKQTPAHGFARIMPWTLCDRSENASGITLVFELSDTPQTRAIWDYPFKLVLTMQLGCTCAVTLAVDAPVETTAALHSYFFVDDLHTATIEGVGSLYQDALQAHRLCEGDEILRITGPVDRVYTAAAPLSRIVLPKRSIEIHHENFSDIVVWNPHEAGEKSIADMQAGDYKNMVCIETARIAKPLLPQDQLGVVVTTK